MTTTDRNPARDTNDQFLERLRDLAMDWHVSESMIGQVVRERWAMDTPYQSRHDEMAKDTAYTLDEPIPCGILPYDIFKYMPPVKSEIDGTPSLRSVAKATREAAWGAEQMGDDPVVLYQHQETEPVHSEEEPCHSRT